MIVILDVRVTKNTLTRALRIMNAIVSEFEKRNIVVKRIGYNNTEVEIDGEEIQFLIREKSKMIKVPSDSPWRAYGTKLEPTGKLYLEIIA